MVLLPLSYITLADFGNSVHALWLSCSQELSHYLFSNLLTLSLPDEGYFRNALCTLNLTSNLVDFIFLKHFKNGKLPLKQVFF
jgi:hypothetical protein